MIILTKYFHERNLFGEKTYSLLTSFHEEHPMENTQATISTIWKHFSGGNQKKKITGAKAITCKNWTESYFRYEIS